MAASHHGDTPHSGNSLTSVPVTPYTTSVDVNRRQKANPGPVQVITLTQSQLAWMGRRLGIRYGSAGGGVQDARGANPILPGQCNSFRNMNARGQS